MALYHWIPNMEDFKSFFKGKWFIIYFCLLSMFAFWGYYNLYYVHPRERTFTEQELKAKTDLEAEMKLLTSKLGITPYKTESYGARSGHDRWTVFVAFQSENGLREVVRRCEGVLSESGWIKKEVDKTTAKYEKESYQLQIQSSDERPQSYVISLMVHI